MSTRNRMVVSAVLIAVSFAALPALAQGGGDGINSRQQVGSPPATGPAADTTVGPAPATSAGTVPPGVTTGQAPAARSPSGVTAAEAPLFRPVPARPCSVAAQETDGTSTCIGLPPR